MVATPMGARRPFRRRREWREWRARLDHGRPAARVENERRPRPASPSSPARPARLASPARLAGRGLIVGGAALVPWMGVLAVRLPSTTQVSNWSVAWIGLDAALAAGLIATGTLMTRGDVRHSLTAAATASLLVMDAWFDVATAPAGPGRTAALALAAGVELPLAGVCAALAVRALRPALACPRSTGVKETDETE